MIKITAQIFAWSIHVIAWLMIATAITWIVWLNSEPRIWPTVFKRVWDDQSRIRQFYVMSSGDIQLNWGRHGLQSDWPRRFTTVFNLGPGEGGIGHSWFSILHSTSSVTQAGGQPTSYLTFIIHWSFLFTVGLIVLVLTFVIPPRHNPVRRGYAASGRKMLNVFNRVTGRPLHGPPGFDVIHHP